MMNKDERRCVRTLLGTLNKYHRWLTPKQISEIHGDPSYERVCAYNSILRRAVTFLNKRVAKP